MKTIKYIAFLLFLISFSSCVKDEKDIFDESPSQRMAKALEKYEKLLTEAENGWLLEYYPEDSKYGGFYLYLSFTKDGKVTITAETSVLKEEEETITSLYVLKSDFGPVLSFDNYNRVLHQFSDPDPDGVGYGGDYEFIIMDGDENKFTLKGKKGQVKMNLIKMPENKSWTEFRSEVDTVVKNYPGFTMEMYVNETKVSFTESDGLGRYLKFETADGVTLSENGMAFIYTPTGIKLKSPVTVNGQEVQNFDLTSDGLLVCTDETTSNIRISKMPLNEAFIKTKAVWYFDPERMGRRFTSLYATIVENLDTMLDEELLLLYFSTSQRLFYLYSYNRPDQMAYPAYFFMDFVPAEQPNELSIYYEGGGDQSAMMIYYSYFRTFLNYISDEAPYVMEYNNLKIPSEITFTRTDNPEVVWFVLTR